MTDISKLIWAFAHFSSYLLSLLFIYIHCSVLLLLAFTACVFSTGSAFVAVDYIKFATMKKLIMCTMMLGLLTGVAEAQKQKKKNTIQKQQTVDQTISSYRANKKMHNNVLMPAQTNPTYTLSNISS